MKNIILIILISLVIPVKAQIDSIFEIEADTLSVYANQSDYLVPAESLLNSSPYRIKYLEKIKETLFSGLPDFFDIQYFIAPSFDAESVLILRENKLIYHKAKQSIWKKYYKEIHGKIAKPETNNKISIEKFNCKINTNDAELIKKMYRTVLSKVRFRIFTPNEINHLLVSNDGTKYSFSLSNYRIIEGITRSPKKGSRICRLVNINNDLIKIVERTPKNETIVLSHNLKKRIKILIDETNLSDTNLEKHTLQKFRF